MTVSSHWLPFVMEQWTKVKNACTRIRPFRQTFAKTTFKWLWISIAVYRYPLFSSIGGAPLIVCGSPRMHFILAEMAMDAVVIWWRGKARLLAVVPSAVVHCPIDSNHLSILAPHTLSFTLFFLTLFHCIYSLVCYLSAWLRAIISSATSNATACIYVHNMRTHY